MRRTDPADGVGDASGDGAGNGAPAGVEAGSELASLRAEVADLRRRVGATEATLAIHQLKARYGELVDRRFSRGRVVAESELASVAAEIAGLFTEDGVWDGGPALGVATGRAEIAEKLRRPTLVFSWHLFAKPRIEVDGDRAYGRWDILCPCRTPDGRSRWMCGFEDDEYTRVAGVWLHRRMKLTTVFVADVGTGWDPIWH